MRYISLKKWFMLLQQSFFVPKTTVDGKLFPVSKNLGSEFEEASTQCDGNVRGVC